MEQGSEQWHADRRLGIGGSDAAAALGLSKWKTPYQLYLEKIGESEPEDESWEMLRGKAMEPALRQHYANEKGHEVITYKTAIVSPKYPWMRYNPDGLTNDRLVEFKTAAYGHGWGVEDTDEIPQEYLLQVQHGMIVADRPITDVTVSIAGNKPKSFVVEADKELQEIIIEREAQFWENVKTLTPPDAISNDDVSRMYRAVNGKSIEITPEISERLTALRDIRTSIKSCEEEKERIEVYIKNFMGENEVLVSDTHVPLVTWKQQKGSRRIDADALRTNFPDIAAQVTTIGDPIRRFLVK